MPTPTTSSRARTGTAVERLRAAPSFVQARTLAGRPYIAKDSEPYTQFWLSERERLLLALFAAPRGASADDAAAGYARLTGKAMAGAERRRVDQAIRELRAAGVLIGSDDDTSRYAASIADDYTRHRPFPRELAERIIGQGPVRKGSRVLDLAGGPGDLALALAQASDHVSLMELSRGFLKTASRRARERGVKLATVHDSCNRLLHHDAICDVVTISQALHWLDDVAVCRGLCRLLQPDGSFFVVHSVMEVPDSHPLAYLLGWDSILGAKARQPFADEVEPLLRRLALLFEALDAPDVERVDPTHNRQPGGTAQRIAPASVAMFRQPRPFGPGYARGFLTPAHIAVTGQAPDDFWRDLDARCAGLPPSAFMGTHHWALLHFKRGASGLQRPAAATLAFEGPAAP